MSPLRLRPRASALLARWPVVLAVAAGVAAAVYAEAAEQPQAAAELQRVVERLNALDTWLDDAGKQLASKQTALKSADRRVAAASGRIRNLSSRIAAAQSTLAGLERERERLLAAQAQHMAHLGDHARAAWRIADANLLKVVLNQQDAHAVDRALRHHAALAQARAAAAEELAATVAAIDGNAAQQQREAQSLRAARTELTDGQKALEAERAQQRRAIADLQADVAASNRERAQLQASRRRLQQLVEELAARTAEAPAGDGLEAGGNLPWPVQGRVQARFGQTRAGGRMRWQGMVIGAERGAPVRTVAGGRVVFADWLRGFGMLAIVDHGDGYMSLYGHADALYKAADDRVEAGETIATVGQSGGQGRPGLYFEIRKAGEPVDPGTWLRSQASR